MAAIRLTQRRVDNLRPRKTVRNVRDAGLKGYGVRVIPSGAKRYFIHSQHRGHRIWKIVGDAAVMTEDEARTRARSLLAALRDDRNIEMEVSGEALFETVAEEVFTRYGRRWKPRTLAVTATISSDKSCPSSRAGRLPESTATRCSGGSVLFTPRRRLRTAQPRSSPSSCSRPRPWGYRPDGGNPCKGIRRYRQKRSERFLSPEEYRRLGMALDRHEARQPFRVAALRLLLLTGCRKSEIITLEWRFYRDGRLYLEDAKTGLRTGSGCARRRGKFSTGCRGRSVSCFPSETVARPGAGLTPSGYSCAPRRAARMFACMTRVNIPESLLYSES